MIVLEHAKEFSLIHPSGRTVYGAVLGDPLRQKVVVYSHGFPACRFEALVARDTARKLDICVVAIDRPGSGRSSHYGGRKLTDWAEDVKLVTDHFGIQKFHLLGVSGGAPFAVAAAVALRGSVHSLALVSGMGPTRAPGALTGMNIMNRALIKLSHTSPRFAEYVIRGIATSWRLVPAIPMLWFGMLLPRVDIEVLRRRDVALIMGRTFKEALSAGVSGAVDDFSLMVSDWEPLLSQVNVPTHVWHGSADTYVPLSMGELLGRSIPRARFTPVSGAGHFMVVDKLPDILSDLLSSSAESRESGL